MQTPGKGWRSAAYIALLAALTWLAYAQVGQFGFTDYDDADYILKNDMVQRGLTAQGLRWALTTTYFSYWHPLTWLSHMADCHFFGLDAGAHHQTNVVLHIAATAALLLALGRLTGSPERSAVVAALFALHPLHVESVAWVAERKDVLSTLFWFLTLWAYAAYAQRPGFGKYLFCLFLFALGLMSKPMLVTVPCVMLLLDFWPLRRLTLFPTIDPASPGPLWRRWLAAVAQHSSPSLPRLILEKVPFLALALASSAITFLGVYKENRMLGLEAVPIGLRLANIPISYLRYIVKMFLPEGMVVLYPMPSHWEAWQIFGSSFALLVLSALVLAFARSYPYLLVGWLWYLGTLVPTIGIIPVGWQSIADRYTYVPLVGLFIIIAWGAADATAKVPNRRWLLGGATAALALLMAMGSAFQTRHWRNTETLFRHAVNVSSNNPIAQYNLALTLHRDGRLEEAARHYRESIRLEPRRDTSYGALGSILHEYGQPEMATNLLYQGLAINPTNAQIHLHLGISLVLLGQTNVAMEHFDRAVQLNPDVFEAQAHRAAILLRQQRAAEGIQALREAVRAAPDWVDLKRELAWRLSTLPDPGLRDGNAALALMQEITNPDTKPSGYDQLVLGAVYAELGRMEEARDLAQKSLALGEAIVDSQLTRKSKALLQSVTAGQPHRSNPSDE